MNKEVFLGGIYCIENTLNNKKYIGLTTNFIKRFKFHYNRLIQNTHKNKHLQASVNKNNILNFEFKVIEYCSEDFLITKEIYYIKKFKTYLSQFGYNKTYGGEFGKVTDEINEIRKLKLKQQIITEEHKEKIRKKLTGHVQSNNTIEKRIQKLRKCSDIIEQKIINSYIIDNNSRNELVKIFNIKHTTICSILKRHNIKRKNI